MSKFCEKCGAEIAENEKVCSNCKEHNTKTNKSYTKYFIIGGIIAVITLVITIIMIVVNNAWKKPLDRYLKGIQKADTEMILSALPDCIVDYYKENKSSDSVTEYVDEILLKIGDALEDKYGENYKMTYKVVKKEKIQKADLKKVEKALNESEITDKDVKVSAGYKARIKITVKGNGESDSNTSTMYFYKIDGKWSWLPVSPSDAKNFLE